MPLDEKKLLEQDAKRNIAEELLQSVRDIKAGRVGRVTTVEVSPLAASRLRIGLSQSEFAKLLGVSLRTLQEWEHGRGEVPHNHCHQETGCFERTACRLIPQNFIVDSSRY
jgi:putative transcriptional regulator